MIWTVIIPAFLDSRLRGSAEKTELVDGLGRLLSFGGLRETVPTIIMHHDLL